VAGMKEINMMDGRKILISRDELTNIFKVIEAEGKGFIKLRSGELINIASISSITTPEFEAYFWGNKMDKSLTRVLIDGEWKNFAGRESQIEWRLKNHSKIAISPEMMKRLFIDKSKDVVELETK
jgi:hypothetical protein